jgi:hypothetical protein
MVKNIKLLIVGSLGALILTGCSSKYGVHFDSNPQGASLVCNGKSWGYTPMWLYYDEKVKSYKTLDASSCSANWISGARKNYPSNLTIYPSGGTTVTLQRPNVEGYEKDAQFALQVQNMEYQKRQAQAAEDAASSAAWQNIQNMNRNNQLQQQNYQLQNINNYLRYGY